MKGLEAVYVVLLGIIFLIVALSIMYSFSTSLECRAAANTTYNNLVSAINKVASDSYPEYTGEGEPSFSDEGYYESVTIRLCQNKLNLGQGSVLAVEPQTQIYYKYPPGYHESGGGILTTWTEDYPWSGGAGSSILSYVGLRAAGSIGKRIYTKVKGVGKAAVVGGKTVILLPKKIYNAMKSLSKEKIIESFKSLSRKIKGNIRTKLLKKMNKYGIREIASKAGIGLRELPYLTKSDIDDLVKSKKIGYKEARRLKKFIKYYNKRTKGDMILLDIVDDQFHENVKTVETLIMRDKNGVLVTDSKGRFIIDPKYKKEFKDITQDFPSSVRKQYVIGSAKNMPNIKMKSISRIKGWFSKTRVGEYLEKRNKKNMDMLIRNIKNAGFDYADDVISVERTQQLALHAEQFSKLHPKETKKLFKLIIKDNPDLIKKRFSVLTGKKVTTVTGKPVTTSWGRAKFLREQLKLLKRGKKIMAVPKKSELSAMLYAQKYFSDDPFRFMTSSIDDQAKLIAKKADVEEDIARKWVEKTRGAAYKSAILPELPSGITYYDIEKMNSILDEQYLLTVSKGGDEIGVFSTFFLGREADLVAKPKVLKTYAVQRAKRAVFFDFGKTGAFYQPSWSSPISLFDRQKLKEQYIENINIQNSLLKTDLTGGIGEQSTQATPLDLAESSVNDIRLWRPKTIGDFEARGIMTLMFGAKENPRFYLVSPCYGIAKVWKKDTTIYISVKKCPVDTEDSKHSNYCYADSNLVWGSASADNTIDITGASAVSGEIVAMAAASLTGTLNPATAKAIAYGTASAYTGTILSMAQSDFQGKQEWGYWTFYKAADYCDIITTIGSFGLSSAVKGAGKTVTTAGAKASAINLAKSAKLSNLVTDMCAAIYMIGEVNYLGYPNRGIIKYDLTDKSYKENEAKCAWEAGD